MRNVFVSFLLYTFLTFTSVYSILQRGVVYSNEHECMLLHVGVYQRSTWWYEQGTLKKYYWVKSVAIVSWTRKFNLQNSFFKFLIPVIQIIICFMHSFLFNNEYFSMTFFFVHVFYPKKNSLAPSVYNWLNFLFSQHALVRRQLFIEQIIGEKEQCQIFYFSTIFFVTRKGKGD